VGVVATDSSNGVAAAQASVSSASSLLRVAGRDPQELALEASIVSFFLDTAEVLGVPKSVAVIYGVCFASAKPLSFADINERLDISQGSISQGLRVLREVGALRVVEPAAGAEGNGGAPIRERRREFFTPDLELRRLAERFLEQRLENHLTSGRARLQAMRATLPAGNTAVAKELRLRMKALQNWHDKTRALVPVMKAFLKLT
jgi:HTH-type transcriptional regulator, glycine betaine synthesis regulator